MLCRINGLGNFIVENSDKKLSSCGARDLYWMQRRKPGEIFRSRNIAKIVGKLAQDWFFCKTSEKWKSIVTTPEYQIIRPEFRVTIQ